VDATGVDAWETLLTQSKEDDAPPCYHLVEKYSTDVLAAPAKFEVKRLGALEHNSDDMVVTSSGYSASNFTGSAI
jgi:hypothetical protein